MDTVRPPADLEQRLADVIDRDWIPRWWTTALPALGDRSPAQAVDDGDRRAVERLISSLENPGAV